MPYVAKDDFEFLFCLHLVGLSDSGKEPRASSSLPGMLSTTKGAAAQPTFLPLHAFSWVFSTEKSNTLSCLKHLQSWIRKQKQPWRVARLER